MVHWLLDTMRHLEEFLRYTKITEFGMHPPKDSGIAVEKISLDVIIELYNLLHNINIAEASAERFFFQQNDGGEIAIKLTDRKLDERTYTISPQLSLELNNASMI